VTVEGAKIAGAQAAADATRDWQAMRADDAIQYAPLPPVKPTKPPAWLDAVSEWLKPLFGPLGEVFAYLFFALLAVIVLYLLWQLFLRLRDVELTRAAPEPEWVPDRAAAVALLEDADRLAAEGRFGEAVHLLLRRSVSHIADARPDWLLPASTAREIALFPMLPERARQAFAAIATRVERSLFALRDLDAGDWAAARSAYADFALARLDA